MPSPRRFPPGVRSASGRRDVPAAGRTAEPPAASSAELQFTVQLVSLEDRGKAESTIRQLKERGFDAYFYEVKVKGKTYYRVRCGKFGTREDAALHAKKLTDQVGMNGFVAKID
jgi:cell division septation protein DedD